MREPPAPARAALAGRDWEFLYDTAPVGLCVLDLAARHLCVNRRFTELTGLPASAFVGRTVEEVNPGAGRMTKKMIRQLVVTGQPIRDLEFSSHRDPQTGAERSWVAHWFPIKDARGRVVAVNVAFEESTEHKRAEVERDRLLDTLDSERSRLSTVLEQMPVGVVLVEAPDGRSLFRNQESARIARHPYLPADGGLEYLRWKLFRLDGSALRPEQYPLARAVLHGEVVTGEEIIIERGDGTRGVISVNAAPVRDHRRKIVAGIVTLFDISAQRETLEALRESEAKFRRIAENSPFGLGSYDAQGRVTFCNSKLLELLGYTERELPRLEDWFAALYPDARYRSEVLRQWKDDIARVRRGELRHSPVREYRAVRRDGTVKTMEITFALGREMTHAVFNDISERKRAEAEVFSLNEHLEERVTERTAQFDQANRELRSEIAERQRLQSQVIEVSEREQRRLGEGLHDLLGQHLTALGMMAAVLERELRKEGHAGAESVAEFGSMLKEAVDAARDLSRGFYPVVLEQGGLILALKDLADSTEAISGVRCRVRHRASFRFPEEAAIHLYRIAQEAVANALKHGAPRKILIELTAVRRVPTLRISNDGLPCQETNAPRTGLGLHIVRHRARLIGAEISVGPGPRGGCEVVCALTGGGK